MYIEKLITKLKTPWLNAGCIRGQMPYNLTEKKWSQLIFYNPIKKKIGYLKQVENEIKFWQ